MKTKSWFWRRVRASVGLCFVLGTALATLSTPLRARAEGLLARIRSHCACSEPFCGNGEEPPSLEVGGSWYWLRSPEQEKRVVMGLFNRYCIRCHGVDGRGVWDIPDVPNFTNARWQACRTDGQLARAILEGRGSVMPPWRGVLSLEEAWAMARYVRTFVPGNEVSRPDVSTPAMPGPAVKPGEQQKKELEKKPQPAGTEKKPAVP